MATTIQAVTRYRPRLIAYRTVGLGLLGARMANGTLVTAPIVRLVLSALHVQIVYALLEGYAVKLPGLGRIALELRADGTVRPVMRFDKTFRSAIADLSDYSGKIQQRENIGLTAAEMVAKWNVAHPTDPVQVGAMEPAIAGGTR